MVRREPSFLILLGTLALVMACANASSDVEGQQSDSGGGDVVVRIGEQVITLEEIDVKAREISLQPYQALYDARRQAVEQIVSDRLLDQEAEVRGITRAELLNEEVNQKAVPITDTEVQAFFDQNQNRMGGRTLEQMDPQIRGYLSSQNLGRAQLDLLERLKTKANVKITLEPPRVDVIVAANDPVQGPAGAAVTIVEYSDFQ
jgi:protein-disulfide isomerase